MTAGAKVTPTEYHRIAWVAGDMGTDVSNLLREMSVSAILDEWKARKGETASAA